MTDCIKAKNKLNKLAGTQRVLRPKAPKFAPGDDESCVICYIGSEEGELVNKHVHNNICLVRFHKPCFRGYMNNRIHYMQTIVCPVCNEIIVVEEDEEGRDRHYIVGTVFAYIILAIIIGQLELGRTEEERELQRQEEERKRVEAFVKFLSFLYQFFVKMPILILLQLCRGEDFCLLLKWLLIVYVFKWPIEILLRSLALLYRLLYRAAEAAAVLYGALDAAVDRVIDVALLVIRDRALDAWVEADIAAAAAEDE